MKGRIADMQCFPKNLSGLVPFKVTFACALFES